MNSKKCKECGKFIDKQENTFCNKSCAAKYNNKKYPKKSKRERICKNCGKIINKYSNNFCDANCYQEYQFKTKQIPLFYDGKVTHNKSLRKILIYLFGAVCVECGNDDTWNDKPLTLQVDHKDGNSDNNMPENVRLLCPNCHTQTPTFCGGKNNIKKTKRNKYLRNYKNSRIA